MSPESLRKLPERPPSGSFHTCFSKHIGTTVPLNALTVDLEDWYHGLTRTMFKPQLWPSLPRRAEETTAQLLDILAEVGVRATFFVLGDLARQSPALIRRIAEDGHELSSHGFSHRRIHELTPAEFRTELDEARQVIEQASGAAVKGFRAPQFSIDHRCLWAFEVLAEAGYLYDSSVFPLKSYFYGYAGASRHPYHPLPDSPLIEYPVATFRFGKLTFPVAGGVYNRLLPYPLIHWATQHINREGFPAVLYLHPWELDLRQPRIPVNPRERVTHFAGRTTLAKKLRRLCKEFEFAPLGAERFRNQPLLELLFRRRQTNQ
jgi:polysaccharide deacetylase family protein (PEP-CTERM system associated)